MRTLGFYKFNFIYKYFFFGKLIFFSIIDYSICDIPCMVYCLIKVGNLP